MVCPLFENSLDVMISWNEHFVHEKAAQLTSYHLIIIISFTHTFDKKNEQNPGDIACSDCARCPVPAQGHQSDHNLLLV